MMLYCINIALHTQHNTTFIQLHIILQYVIVTYNIVVYNCATCIYIYIYVYYKIQQYNYNIIQYAPLCYTKITTMQYITPQSTTI